MRGGWYITGDVATMDEDGFIQITDRLSRFSKIGGEMVAHGRIEEALQEVAGIELQAFAVTGIPDERKGERLAVLHTVDETAIPALLEKIAARGLPNLFIPHPDDFVKIDKLPLLGTGKLDLRAVKQIAIERLGRAMTGPSASREDGARLKRPSNALYPMDEGFPPQPPPRAARPAEAVGRRPRAIDHIAGHVHPFLLP